MGEYTLSSISNLTRAPDQKSLHGRREVEPRSPLWPQPNAHGIVSLESTIIVSTRTLAKVIVSTRTLAKVVLKVLFYSVEDSDPRQGSPQGIILQCRNEAKHVS